MRGIGIAQNHPREHANRPSEETYLFNTEEKRALVDRFGRGEHPEVYIVEEHAGGEKQMSAAVLGYKESVAAGQSGHMELPNAARLGRVADLMLDGRGNLVTEFELFHENPRAHEIKRAIHKGEKWGLSVGVDADLLPAKVLNKRLVHVGLTRQPEYGDETTGLDPGDPTQLGTWVYDAAVSGETIDKLLASKYLNQEGAYVSERTRTRVRRNLEDPFLPAQVTVGASHPPSDSISSISADASGARAAVSPPPSVAMSDSIVNSLNPVPPQLLQQQEQQQAVAAAAAAAQQQQQQTPADPPPPSSPSSASADPYRRKFIDDMEKFRDEARQFLQNPMPRDLVKADRLFANMKSLMGTPSYASELDSNFFALLSRVGQFLDTVNHDLNQTIDAMEISDDEKELQKTLLRKPAENPQIATSVLASRNNMANMRLAQSKLDKEIEENKKLRAELEEAKKAEEASRKRQRDFELEQAAATQEKRSRVDYGARFQAQTPAPQPLEQKPIPTSVGASRFVGSQLPPTSHIPDLYWGDFNMTLAEFKSTPWAKKEYDNEGARNLQSIAYFAEQAMANKGGHIMGQFLSNQSG